MEIIKRKMAGVFEIRLSPIGDERGSFMRTYDQAIFEQAGIDRPWVQENHSRSASKGTIRGLHFQFPPHAESKLVRCIRGRIFDAFVDLREGSPTFGKWDGLELSEASRNMVLIPRGFAHGFCTLTDSAEVLYKVDNAYDPKNESGLLWSDPGIGIEWPLDGSPTLSARDQVHMTLEQFKSKHKSLSIELAGSR